MSEALCTLRVRGAERPQATTKNAIATIATRFMATISADGVPLKLFYQPFAADSKMLPGNPFVGIARDYQNEIVALLQIATENLRVLELDRQPLQLARCHALAGSFEIGKKNALVRADRAQPFRPDVEHALGPGFDRFSFLIEKHGADRTRGALQHLAQDGVEGHVRRRRAPALR